MQRLVCFSQCSIDFQLGVCERLNGTDLHVSMHSRFLHDAFTRLSVHHSTRWNQATSARFRGWKNWIMVCPTTLHVSQLCHRSSPNLHVCQVACEWIARVSSLCCQYRPHVHDVSTPFVISTMTDIDAMFACQTTLHLWFCVFIFPQSILKFLIVCNTASLDLTLPSSMRLTMSSSLWPMPNQPEIWVPTTLLGALSPVCASGGVILIVPPPLKSTSLLTRKFWIHSACRTAHCATGWSSMISALRRLASSTMICKRSLNARTRCSARPFAWLCSTAVTSVGNPSRPAFLCTTLRKRSSLFSAVFYNEDDCKLNSWTCRNQTSKLVVHQPLLQSFLNEVSVFHVALRLFVTRSAHSHQRVRQFVWWQTCPVQWFSNF